MDKKSWLWRRRSSENSPGETGSSGSVSSISERYSDDQEAFRTSPNTAQSPDVSSKIVDHELRETMKSLTEKLSAAHFSISAKEELVKEHARVAEEAVAGWEKAENEVAALKQQIQVTNQRNVALDDAIKECVRQLRQSRDEQEKKFCETLIEKTDEWKFQKYELETRIDELRTQVEALEKVNSTLKVELLSAFDDLQIMKLEKELSTRAAEAASKQHLESTRKVAKLEAECQKLRATMKKSTSFEVKNLASSVDIELMDDFLEMERLAALPEINDNLSIAKEEPSRDEFEKKLEKVTIEKQEVEMVLEETRNQLKVSHDRLILAEGKVVELQLQLNLANGSKHYMEIEIETLESKEKELESQLEARESEVKKLQEKVGLFESIEAERRMLKSKLISAQFKGEQLQGKISSLEAKLKEQCTLSAEFTSKTKVLEEQKEALRSQLEDAHVEVKNLREKMGMLEKEVEAERALSSELAEKCRSLEDRLEAKEREVDLRQLVNSTLELKMRQERDLAVASGKLADCQRTISSISKQLQSLTEFDLMLEVQEPVLDHKERIRISQLLQERDLRAFSVSSSLLTEYGKCLSPGRSIQSQ